jgi:Flp pilus assembly pilin Flp
MSARYSAPVVRAIADRRGISSVEYAVFAAAVVGTLILSARNFVTALADIINSFTVAL